MGNSILFFVTLFSFLRVSVSTDNCPIRRPCNSSDYNFSVSFPFRIAQYQPNTRCSYDSNFTLSCNPRDQTLLNLSKAGSFAINTISYSIQRVTLTDPDGCLPQRFLNFNLSGSPFYPYSYQNYTYYNCSRLTRSSFLYYYGETCMSGNIHTVVVYPGAIPYYLEETIIENNCTLIKSVAVPYYRSSRYYNLETFNLYWDVPQCWYCRYDQTCGLKSGSNLAECQDLAKTSISSATNTILILFLVVLPGMLVIICVLAYACRRRSGMTEESQLNHQDTQMVQSQPSVATTTAIESNPMFVLAEGDVLLEPNVSPCAICLAEYKSGDALRTIVHCNHFFHSHCVDEWLKIKGTCPVCRNCT